jgi:superfamily II DNA or RNA helicase
MTEDLRPYQITALERVEAAHQEVKSVCLVAPTAAGKTRMFTRWAKRRIDEGKAGVMYARRIELLTQAQEAFAECGVRAGIIAPGYPSEPWLKMQCASVETVISRGEVPECDFQIADECHGFAAETHGPVLKAQPNALLLGVTATPQRGDGKPLGDLFQRMVVAAQYSELIRMGFIVPCRVFRPEHYLGGDFAKDPLEAWLERSSGKRGFAFCRTVSEAGELAKRMREAGVRARNVDGKMADTKRKEAFAMFEAGDLDCLTNVHICTEGVNIPAAEVCMLASNTGITAVMMQRAGRVLRAAPGKTEAILIDLPGCTHEHGIPTADREYSLDGRPMATKGDALSVCLKCGYTQLAQVRTCEGCGHEKPKRAIWQGPKIWNVELLEYYENAGELTDAPSALKKAEWERLLSVCEQKKFGISFAVSEYERVFQGRPVDGWLKELGDDVRLTELKRLLSVQMSRGLKLGWISHAYKQTFGAFPSRGLREQAGVPLPSAEEWAR